MAKKIYTDKEKIEYWRKKALQGASNAGKSAVYNKVQYKKSSATYTKITRGAMEGLYAINAYKKNRTGIVRAVAMPISNKVAESEKGKEYIPYLVTCIDMNTLQSSKYNALLNVDTKVLIIRDLGMCISPNGSGVTKSGARVKGYFGKISK